MAELEKVCRKANRRNEKWVGLTPAHYPADRHVDEGQFPVGQSGQH